MGVALRLRVGSVPRATIRISATLALLSAVGITRTSGSTADPFAASVKLLPAAPDGSATWLIPTIGIAPGVHMPMLVMGGYNITGDSDNHPSNYSLWLADGNVGIDTAWEYQTQRDIARAIQESGVPRERLFITSKIPCSRNDSSKYPNPTTKADAARYIAQDLAQLQTDYIDLMLIHWPCMTSGETAALWAAMEDALQSKKLRALGVSNFRQPDFEALAKTARVKPVLNQCQMSVGMVDRPTLAYCRTHGITYEAYSALQGGGMANPRVKAIAAAHSVTTAAVLLRWVVQQGVVVATGSMEQAYDLQDEAIFRFNLTSAEMAALDAI